MDRLLAALKTNRNGHRDWLIGLIIYRHGMRVSEACDLRWDDLDLSKRTITVRRLKGSTDSVHYLERDELIGLRRLQREQGPRSAYVFVNERRQPFGRMGIGRMIERAGEAAKLTFPVHVHMLRHSTGFALAGKGMDTRRLQHYLGHASITNTVGYTAMSPEPFKDRRPRLSGAAFPKRTASFAQRRRRAGTKGMVSRGLRNFVHCCAAVIGVVRPYLYVWNRAGLRGVSFPL